MNDGVDAELADNAIVGKFWYELGNPVCTTGPGPFPSYKTWYSQDMLFQEHYI